MKRTEYRFLEMRFDGSIPKTIYVINMFCPDTKTGKGMMMLFQ